MNLNKYYYTSKNGWKEIDGEWYILDYKDGLLFASIEITYKGKSKMINNVVI